MKIVPDPNHRLIDDNRSKEGSNDDPRFAAVDKYNGVEEGCMGAKLRGTYTDYKNMMIAKHNNYGRSTRLRNNY